jgi:hypothetical protein
MKKILTFFILITVIVSSGYAQRVRGKIRKGSGENEVIVSILPNQAFQATITNLIVSVQIPKAAVNNIRPEVSFESLQPSLFAPFEKIDDDQGDDFYTWAFSQVDPPHPATTNWAATDLDVLKISFLGTPVNPFQVRLCHYLDGGTNKSLALFYVETNLAAINGGVLSDWGSLFIGAGAVNGTTAAGNIGTPNANYSFVPVSGITLPVNFLSFYALKNGDNAKLTWSVEKDQDNKNFEVLRSLDGRDFKSIQTINALGNGRSLNNYETVDFNINKLNTREVFYQIKQIDKDGTITKSAIRTLSVDGLGKAVTAFPNPAKTTTKVIVDAPAAGQGTLILRDGVGRQMNVINAHFFKGINQFDMNLMNMASGEYNIQVNGGGVKETIKITKIN